MLLQPSGFKGRNRLGFYRFEFGLQKICKREFGLWPFVGLFFLVWHDLF